MSTSRQEEGPTADHGSVPTGVSVVVPVLDAEPYLPALLEALFAQEPAAPEEVLLVDSMSTDRTREIAGSYARVRVVPIEDFSHGRARNLGIREAACEVVVVMTQDALPRDRTWLAQLLAPLAEARVAAVFSRQVPREHASPMERFFLAQRFPPGERMRRELRGSAPLTLESVFFSNVSAALRRELVLTHPFDEELIMSEDQQWARDVIAAGYVTVYEPASVVLHSHAYSLPDVFRRYFDSVYSLTVIFPRHGFGTSASMGLRYLRAEAGHMLRRHPTQVPYYALYTLAKISGTLLGHCAPYLPLAVVRRLSLHRYHWKDREPQGVRGPS